MTTDIDSSNHVLTAAAAAAVLRTPAAVLLTAEAILGTAAAAYCICALLPHCIILLNMLAILDLCTAAALYRVHEYARHPFTPKHPVHPQTSCSLLLQVQ